MIYPLSGSSPNILSSALKGIRVVEICKSIAGPYCASLLGDMGADVIKIENPDGGDDFRQTSPIFNGESYYFMLANRNKRSLTLNLKDEDGRRIILELSKQADILIQNFRPGTMKRLGLDYDSLKSINPKLVYCSISGFGQDGPYRDRAAYDLVLQAMGGIMSVTGQKGGDPTYVGVPIVDILTALFAVYGILSSLIAREKTGEGQHVDASMFDASIAPLMQLAGLYFATGKIPGPGQKQDVMVPYGLFRAKDGFFVIEASSHQNWIRLCKVTGMGDWAEDPRFTTGSNRARYGVIITERLSEVFKGKTVSEWLKLLINNGVPAGPVNNMQQVFTDTHTIHRQMVTEVDHSSLGKVKLVGIPIKLSSTPARISIAPPLLGQHTIDILRDLGYDDSQIETLRRKGAI